MQSSRREAIFVVAQWLATRDFPDRMISDGPDRAFVTDLVYTTVRRFRTLDWALRKLVKKMPSGETEAALFVGAAQILFMPDVKEYAAVNETVNAAKTAARASAGLVNGVLRNLIRQKTALLADLEKEPLAVRTSHPDALVAHWLKRFGEEETRALCEWDNQPAEVFLAYPPGAPEPFVKLPRGKRVEEMPGYAEGAFIVQDPATAAAVDLLDVHPGQTVLDACSAPGGKTVQIAWRLGAPKDPHQKLIAADLYEDRLVTVRANLKRTHLDWVEVRQLDLTADPAQALGPDARFDRILLDAPCSNSGVLRRRPDARWRWSLPRLEAVLKTQTALLESALKLLAPGGKLVYSTCSLEPEENRHLVNAILKEHPGFACTAAEARIPTRSHTDGAFACVIEPPSA